MPAKSVPWMATPRGLSDKIRCKIKLRLENSRFYWIVISEAKNERNKKKLAIDLASTNSPVKMAVSNS